MKTTDITKENLNSAIESMFRLWELGVTNNDSHDILRRAIIKRYKKLPLPHYIHPDEK